MTNNPNAFVSVPREATEEMRAAGRVAWMNRNLADPASEPIRDCYKAMLAAAPSAPVVGEDELRKALERAEELEDKIAEIEGVWPEWAEKLLSILKSWGAAELDEDGYNLPEELQNWLTDYRTELEATANKRRTALTSADGDKG